MKQKQVNMVTFAMILANVMAGLDSTIINTAIPAIVASLHGIQFMGWIIAVMLLGMSISIPIWNKVGAKFGNKAAFELSLLFFILGSLFQGLASNMYFFLFARMVMGIGAGGMGSLPYVMAGYIFANLKQRTRILGYLGASFSVATIIGPLVGGYLVDAFSWHWVFYINLPIGLIAILLSLVYYREKRAKEEARFDLKGAFLIVCGLILILLGIQGLGLAAWWLLLLLIAAGFCLLALFFNYESKADDPILPVNMFKNQPLVGDLLLFVFTWGAFLAVNIYLPLWAQGLLGTSALIGGMTLMPNSLADALGTQVVNQIQAHLDHYFSVILAIACMLLSSLGMALMPLKAGFWLITLVAAFSGFGVGFVFVLLQIKVQVDAGPKDMAPATSLSYLIRILAQTVMAAVYGVIMNLALERGIAQHRGITMAMMNKLSSASAAKTLPSSLLPVMRQIFYGGLKEIMIAASFLLVIALCLNYYYNRYLPRKK